MILNDGCRELLLKYSCHEISKNELIEKYPEDLSQQKYLAELYAKIYQAESGDDFEYASMLEPLFRGAIKSREHNYLKFAYAPWHRLHEELALVDLPLIGTDDCVEAIFHIAVTNHAYLDDDDVENLAVQCTYALSNIETPRAIEKLKLLSQSTNERIKSEALQRLEEIGESQ
jgi:hypothetical protein